jgi:hypothetical protein
LTAVLLVVFTVWSVDTVLWLGVQILQYPLAVQSLMPSHQVLLLPHEQITETASHLLSQDGYIAAVQALVTL